MKAKNTGKKSNLNKNNLIIRTLLIYLCYFLYVTVISDVLLSLGNFNNTVIMFIADFVFLIGIVFLFKDKLRDDFLKIKNKYKPSQIVRKILFWVVVILVFNILMGAITESIYPNLALDDNTTTLFDGTLVYTIFKTMVFAIVAEELLFRESLNSIIDNNVLFVIVSTLIYTVLNFLIGGITYNNVLENVIYILIFSLPAIILSIAYIKTNRNIIMLMLIKFVYQLIPLTILLLGL